MKTSPRWKLRADAVPVELRENCIVRYLASLTPEEEASLERADELEETADGGPTDGS